MSDWRRVTLTLFRIYRPIALWFWGMVAVGIAIASYVINYNAGPQTISLWLVVAGFGAKYWLGVVGVLLISLQLKSFVANGITRRAFLIGGAVFGLLGAVGFALMAPIGHAVEDGLLSLFVDLPAQYPAISVSGALTEFGQTLPADLAFLVAGATVTAGFYRFGGLGGLLVMIPALLPVGVVEGLFNFDGGGVMTTRFLPYAAALAVSLAATALGALLLREQIRQVAIRRTAG